MTELKFNVLRFAINVLFSLLLFYGFMCGVHYGTELIGLYFVAVKVLLGILSLTAALFVFRGLKTSVLFVIKNATIYAQAKGSGVLEAFKGVFVEYKSTVSINVLNKLVRESLDYLEDLITKEKSEESSGDLDGILDNLKQSDIFKATKKILIKSMDYTDECILGYCYKNVSEEKNIMRCCLEGLVLFCVNCVPICKKMMSVIIIQMMIKIVYWVAYVALCLKYVNFSLMNLILCYVIGMLLDFILEDSFYEPALMSGIVKQFSEYEWKEDFEDKISELVGKIPAVSKIGSYCGKTKESSDFDSASNAAAETVSEEEDNGEIHEY